MMTDVNQDLEFIMRAQDRATDVIDRVEGRLGGLSSRLGRISDIAGGFVVGQGLMRLGDTLMGLVSSGIEFNASMEQNSIAFTTMLGSADAAKEHLEELINFAKNTPFEQRDVIEGSKRLQAFGFEADKIIPTLTAVGDAAAGLGMGGEGVNRIIYALGQMRAKAKVSGEEMMQLTEAGIPAWEILAKKMGKTVPELMDMSQKGIIPVKEALDGLITGMGERFPNMMEKQSKSFQGMMSTVKDTIAIASGKIMKPIFERLQPALTGLLSLVSGGGFDAIIDSIGNGIGGAISFVADGIGKVIGLVSPVVGVIGTIAGYFRETADSGDYLNDSLTDVSGPLQSVISIIGRGIGIVGQFMKYLDPGNTRDLMRIWFGPNFGPRIDEAVRAVKDFVGGAKNFFSVITSGAPASRALMNTIERIFGKDRLSEVLGYLDRIRHVGEYIKGPFLGALGSFFGVLVGGAPATRELMDLLGRLFGKERIAEILGSIEEFRQGFQNAFVAIRDHLLMVAGLVLDNLAPAILNLASKVLPIALSIFNNVADVVANKVIPILSTLGEWLMSKVIPAVQGIAAALGSFYSEYGPRFIQALTNIVNFISDWVIPVIGAYYNLIVDGIEWVLGIWIDHWDQIRGVLEGVWNIIEGVVKIAWSVVSGVIRLGLDLLTANWEGAWNDIKFIFRGVWDGIIQILGGSLSIIINLLSLVWDTVATGVRRAWDGIAWIIRGVWNLVVEDIKKKANEIIDAINALIGGANAVMGFFGGGSINLIPHLAMGTRNFSGGLALVGERGPELVALPRGASVTPLSSMTVPTQSPMISGQQAIIVSVEVNGSVLSELDLQDVVIGAIEIARNRGRVA